MQFQMQTIFVLCNIITRVVQAHFSDFELAVKEINFHNLLHKDMFSNDNSSKIFQMFQPFSKSLSFCEYLTLL